MNTSRKEDYGLVLDYLPYGNSGQARKEPLIQVVGESYFTLLEIVAVQGKSFSAQDRIYIGKGERADVDHIKGRVNFEQLTSSATRELPQAVRSIVSSREADFVGFLNRAGAINIRAHTLELLPGVGKKHLEELLGQREKKPFESYADVATRVSHLGDSREIFVSRILEELKGNQKYYLFTKSPAEEHEEDDRRFRRDDAGRGSYRR